MIVLSCINQAVLSQNSFSFTVKQPKYIKHPDISWATVSKNEEIQIFWQKQLSDHIEYYNIYRSSDLDSKWELVGKVDYNSATNLNDLNCFANIQSYKYKIAAVDKCGYEIFSNEIFKTIFLKVLPYQGGRKIIQWNPCEGMSVQSYQIYKGLTPYDLVVIDSTFDGETTFIDKDSISTDCYYQVVAIGTKSSTNNIVLKSSTGYFEDTDARSFSNLVIYTYDSLRRKFSNENFVIYPNPLITASAIKFLAKPNETYQMHIIDLTGNSVLNRTLTSGEFVIEKGNLKEGIYIIDIANSHSHIKKKLIVGSLNL